jgi:hypothetical protein
VGAVGAASGAGAVDDDVTAGAAGGDLDGSGDLLPLAESAHRRRSGSLGPVELALGDHVSDHRSLDGAGADSVDADPARRVLQGGAGSQPDHPVLGSVIGGPARESDETAEGGAVDDGAAALGAHLAQLMLHAGPHPAQVDRTDPVEDPSVVSLTSAMTTAAPASANARAVARPVPELPPVTSATCPAKS